MDPSDSRATFREVHAIQSQAVLPKSPLRVCTPGGLNSPLHTGCPGVPRALDPQSPSRRPGWHWQTLCCLLEWHTLDWLGPQPALPQSLCPLRQRTGVPCVPLGYSPASQPQAPGARASLGGSGGRSHFCPWPGLGPSSGASGTWALHRPQASPCPGCPPPICLSEFCPPAHHPWLFTLGRDPALPPDTDFLQARSFVTLDKPGYPRR